MGAWNLTTRLVLFVVFLNDVQAFDAVPNGNCSHGLQRDILKDLRKFSVLIRYQGPVVSEVDAQVVIDFQECAVKWRATIGEPCISDKERDEKSIWILITHWGDVPWGEYKALAGQVCKNNLICSAARNCEWKDSTMVSSTCSLSENPKKDLVRNCEKEIKAHMELLLGKITAFIKAVIIIFAFFLLVIIRFVVAPLCTHGFKSIRQILN